MRRRPLVGVTLAFLAGIALAPRWPIGWPAGALWGMCALCWTASLGIRRAQPWLRQLSLSLAILFLGSALYVGARLPLDYLYAKAPYLKEISGVVVDYPTHGPQRTDFVLKPQGEVGFLQVHHYHEGAPLPIAYGDRVWLAGKFQAPEPFEGFDYRAYLEAREIWAVVRVKGRDRIRVLAHDQGNALLQAGYRLRGRLFGIIDRAVPAPQAGALKALLFGERGYLGRELEEDFRDAGVAHVLAVSGLHLGILVAMFWGTLRFMGFSASGTYILVGGWVLLYLILVGFKVSLVRAALLFAFIALGAVLRERGWIVSAWVDPLQGLSAAALVILSQNPKALFEVGFQLSFCATASILLFLPGLEPLLRRVGLGRLPEPEHKPWPQRLRRALARGAASTAYVSLAAQLGVLPVIAAHFHRLYLGAVLANLLVVPLVTLILWLGVAVVVWGALPWAGPSQLLGRIEGGLLLALAVVVRVLARLPGMSLAVAGFPGWLALGYFTALFQGAERLTRRLRLRTSPPPASAAPPPGNRRGRPGPRAAG